VCVWFWSLPASICLHWRWKDPFLCVCTCWGGLGGACVLVCVGNGRGGVCLWICVCVCFVQVFKVYYVCYMCVCLCLLSSFVNLPPFFVTSEYSEASFRSFLALKLQVLYSALYCSVSLYIALQCSIVLYSALQCSVLLYSALYCSIVLYIALYRSILLYSAL